MFPFLILLVAAMPWTAFAQNASFPGPNPMPGRKQTEPDDPSTTHYCIALLERSGSLIDVQFGIST